MKIDTRHYEQILWTRRKQLANESMYEIDNLNQHVKAGPYHPAEHATESMDQDLACCQLSHTGLSLNRITRALRRIQEGVFGLCEECGGHIEHSRLTAVPDADFCLKCQDLVERTGRR